MYANTISSANAATRRLRWWDDFAVVRVSLEGSAITVNRPSSKARRCVLSRRNELMLRALTMTIALVPILH